MAIMASDKGGKDFKKVPPGAHFAICNLVADCGLQEGFNGKRQHKIYIRWEVPDERVSYEKYGEQKEGPCSIGSMYTLSLSDKANLRKVLENWRGKPFTPQELQGFDITNVLGKCCQIMVTHSEDGKYANVTGVMGISKDQRARAQSAQPENKPIAFSLEDYDEKTFQSLPNWLKEKINTRMEEPTEAPPSTGSTEGADDLDGEIPF